MTVEHWLQILVASVILSTLGWMGSNQFDMKGIMASVDTKVTLNDQRLSRIADVLPEVKVRVAWEEVNFPLSGFISASEPQMVTTDKWETFVKLYNAKNQKMNIYSLTLNEEHKDFLSLVVAGKVRSAGRFDPSFMELAAHSAELKHAVMIPKEFEATTSFVLRDADISEYETFFRKITGEPQVITTVKMGSWKEIGENFPELEKQVFEIRNRHANL